MRLFCPKRVIEVGSGFSSALMLDVNDRFLNGQTEFTFIDPNGERLNEVLRPNDFSKARIIAQAVQRVPLSIFQELQANDILFIDSSHVSKAGSDVNYLYFEVLSRLAPGVLVQVHDVFWPFEYPCDWIREGRAWNEAYLLRAFLSFNANFEIVFWAPYAAERWRDLIASRMPDYMENTGASLWLRRTH
jgi:predicted O-methyltransferase YrrM